MPKRLDANQAAHRLLAIITGEARPEPQTLPKSEAAVELGRRGGHARAAKLGTRRKRAIAKAAAAARWRKTK